MFAYRLLETHAYDDGVNAWAMRRIAPPPALIGLVTGYTDYHESTGSFTTRRELPHGNGVLIINLGAPIFVIGGDGQEIQLGAGEAFVAGFHLRPALSRSGGAQAGIEVGIPLLSLRRLLGLPMEALLDRVISLSAILGANATRLGAQLVMATTVTERVALLDAALIKWFAHSAPAARAQRHALHLLAERPEQDIMAVASELGWSRKHLANRVRDVVGVGPRSYRRVLRFEQLVKRLGDYAAPDWAGLAADAGYYDQSHMIRDFRDFAEMTPGDYIKRLMPAGGGLIEA